VFSSSVARLLGRSYFIQSEDGPAGGNSISSLLSIYIASIYILGIFRTGNFRPLHSKNAQQLLCASEFLGEHSMQISLEHQARPGKLAKVLRGFSNI